MIKKEGRKMRKGRRELKKNSVESQLIRNNGRDRNPPFLNPPVIIDSSKDHQLMLISIR